MKGAVMFTPAMARAVREGRKTQTRRIARHESDDPSDPPRPSLWQTVEPGARLWVREPFRGARGYDALKPTQWGNKPVWYEADGQPPMLGWSHLSDRARIARVMPRLLSRTTLIVEATRIERLQDISEEDACREGWPGGVGVPLRDTYPIGWFANLWNDLHGKGAWDANQEVVVITFRAVPRNIDQMDEAA